MDKLIKLYTEYGQFWGPVIMLLTVRWIYVSLALKKGDSNDGNFDKYKSDLVNDRFTSIYHEKLEII